MPILTNKPAPKPQPAPTSPVVTEQPIHSTPATDTRYESRRSLLSHVEGMPWRVKYYQQLLSENSELSPLAPAKDPVYQQYTRINQLEIRVTTPLAQSQTAQSKNFEVTGEAILYPPMTPNKGDMFIADIGDGREGLFAVTETERLSIMKEACYQVSYVLTQYTDNQTIEELDAKTVKYTHFVKRLLDHGEDPVIVDDDYHRYLSLQQYWERLLGHYMGQFFNKTASTLLVPNQPQPTYDPFVVKFIASFISSTQHPLLRYMKKYAVDLPDRNRPWTIWDAVLTLSDSVLPMVEELNGIAHSRLFGELPQFEGVHYSNIEWVVYPHNPKEPLCPTHRLSAGELPAADIRHQFDTSRLSALGDFTRDNQAQGIDGLVPIHRVTADEYYVLSKAFYHGEKEHQSQLETLVQMALTRTPVNQKTLTELCDQCHKWPQLEQFYFTPLLLVMIKMVLRGQ